MPAIFAGTIHKSASHQLSHCDAGGNVTRASGSQPSMPNVLATMREPGARLKNFGASRFMFTGSRKSAITVALEMSYWYMSASTNCALSPTPASRASLRESATMSGLYSTPSACAPSFAAAITLRPSPDPRSITKSFDVTWPSSIILLTMSGGDGTHTTSLPGWPGLGSNGAAGG